MTQLVSFYESAPIRTKRHLATEVAQRPLAESESYTSTDGSVQPMVVYATDPSAPVGGAGQALLIPFGKFEDWLMRDRYNEALRIMTSLGASDIECVAYRTTTRRRRLGLRKGAGSAEGSYERVQNSGYDFKHVGSGGPPQDPAPLKWPNEPGFEAARNSVLRNGAREVHINLRSSDVFRADSSLGIQLRKVGFSLGADGSLDTVNSLSITAKFPDVSGAKTARRNGW